jgi:hypothetical protein
MPDLKVHDHYRPMTRQEVAAELRRLATQLEVDGRIPYLTGAVVVPVRIEREFVLDESGDGAACRFEYRLRWPVCDD